MMTTRERSEAARLLVDTAMGRRPADTVIQGVTLINVNTGELQPAMDIAIAGERIALVGDASHCVGTETVLVDGTGLYAAPGFMDGHIHVESAMLTVREYARTVVPHGTTAIFPDPHEIANILGERGLRFMIENARDLPMRTFTLMPSCVPAVPGFEDTGAELTPADVERFLADPEIFGLGEMMNYPGILAGEAGPHEKVASTLTADKTVTGHYAVPEHGRGLNAYVAAGIRCCHESTRAEDALAKMRLGMYAQLREGSAWHDLHEVIKAVTERTIDPRFANLISDDTHPYTLSKLGHLDHVVRRAIEEGLRPVTAIQMVTINVAECFGMARDLGSISPGKLADIVLLRDLARVDVKTVFMNGRLVAEGGALTVALPPLPTPDFVKNTIRVPGTFTAADFTIPAPKDAGDTVQARVIHVVEAKVGTRSTVRTLGVRDGLVPADPVQGINKLAVVERHKNTGQMGRGYVSGLGLAAGAIASTVAHDAHNLMLVGANDADMALAANTLADCGGGMVAVLDGRILALLPLPVAGIMSEESVDAITGKVEALDRAWKRLGCHMVSPFMTTALISLGVLPELRLTNKGLIDTVNFRFTELFVQPA